MQLLGMSAGGDLAGTYPNPTVAANSIGGGEVQDDSLGGSDVAEATLGKVPSATNADTAANASKLGNLFPTQFLRSDVSYDLENTVGLERPFNGTDCAGNESCYFTLSCGIGKVLLDGGFSSLDSGTRLDGAYPFSDESSFVMHWANNSTADTVTLHVLCVTG